MNVVTIVSYDHNEPDIPCVVCGRKEKDGSEAITVGYVNENAETLQKIVSKQGYLPELLTKIKKDTIAECLGIVKFYANEYDGIEWAIRELEDLKGVEE